MARAVTDDLRRAGFVERALKKRGLDLPDPPYPTRWERLLHPEQYDDG